MKTTAEVPWSLMLDIVTVLRRINKDHTMNGDDAEWEAWDRVKAIFLNDPE